MNVLTALLRRGQGDGRAIAHARRPLALARAAFSHAHPRLFSNSPAPAHPAAYRLGKIEHILSARTIGDLVEVLRVRPSICAVQDIAVCDCTSKLMAAMSRNRTAASDVARARDLFSASARSWLARPSSDAGRGARGLTEVVELVARVKSRDQDLARALTTEALSMSDSFEDVAYTSRCLLAVAKLGAKGGFSHAGGGGLHPLSPLVSVVERLHHHMGGGRKGEKGEGLRPLPSPFSARCVLTTARVLLGDGGSTSSGGGGGGGGTSGLPSPTSPPPSSPPALFSTRLLQRCFDVMSRADVAASSAASSPPSSSTTPSGGNVLQHTSSIISTIDPALALSRIASAVDISQLTALLVPFYAPLHSSRSPVYTSSLSAALAAAACARASDLVRSGSLQANLRLLVTACARTWLSRPLREEGEVGEGVEVEEGVVSLDTTPTIAYGRGARECARVLRAAAIVGITDAALVRSLSKEAADVHATAFDAVDSVSVLLAVSKLLHHSGGCWGGDDSSSSIQPLVAAVVKHADSSGLSSSRLHWTTKMCANALYACALLRVTDATQLVALAATAQRVFAAAEGDIYLPNASQLIQAHLALSPFIPEGRSLLSPDLVARCYAVLEAVQGKHRTSPSAKLKALSSALTRLGHTHVLRPSVLRGLLHVDAVAQGGVLPPSIRVAFVIEQTKSHEEKRRPNGALRLRDSLLRDSGFVVVEVSDEVLKGGVGVEGDNAAAAAAANDDDDDTLRLCKWIEAELARKIILPGVGVMVKEELAAA